jgi:ribosomal protein S18 acetylase RimI-like enzyme
MQCGVAVKIIIWRSHFMGHQGRFGKYGENKPPERLRRAGNRDITDRAVKVGPGEARSFSKKKATQRARIRIGPAGPLDLDFIRSLSGRAFQKYGSYQDVISQWFQSEMTGTIVGRIERRPVGFAIIGLVEDEDPVQKVCELLAIAVELDKRHKGIGQMLMTAVDKKAVEWQMERIVLHTAQENLPARSLFTKNGFIPWGMNPHFYPAGQDALVMSKVIHS